MKNDSSMRGYFALRHGSGSVEKVPWKPANLRADELTDSEGEGLLAGDLDLILLMQK